MERRRRLHFVSVPFGWRSDTPLIKQPVGSTWYCHKPAARLHQMNSYPPVKETSAHHFNVALVKRIQKSTSFRPAEEGRSLPASTLSLEADRFHSLMEDLFYNLVTLYCLPGPPWLLSGGPHTTKMLILMCRSLGSSAGHQNYRHNEQCEPKAKLSASHFRFPVVIPLFCFVFFVRIKHLRPRQFKYSTQTPVNLTYTLSRTPSYSNKPKTQSCITISFGSRNSRTD